MPVPAAHIPAPQEVIPKAVLREAIASAPAPNQPDFLAKKINEVADTEGWRKAIELGKQTPIEQARIGKLLGQFGVERDAATGAKTLQPPEQARYDAAKTASQNNQDYIEKGYDALTPGQQTIFENMVKDVLQQRPALLREYNDLVGLGLHGQAVERILRDPRVTSAARRLFQEVLDLPALADAVTERKEQMEVAQIDVDTANDDFKSADRRYKAVDNHLKAYERDATGNPIGVNATRITDLNKDLPNFKSAITKAEADLAAANNIIPGLEEAIVRASKMSTLTDPLTGKALADLQTDYNAARLAASTARTEINNNQAKINELERLQAEERTLEDRKTQTEQERRQKEADLKKKKLDLAKKQREYQDALALRESQEKDLVSGTQNVLKEAVNEVLDQEITQLTAELTKQVDALKAEAKTADENAMADALKSELSEVKTRKRLFRKPEKYVAIKAAKTEDYYAALVDKGPKEAMKKLLLTQNNPQTGSTYNEAEVNTIFKDSAYIEKMQPQVVKQILARKMVVSGISGEDAYAISSTDWGKEMVDQALKFNDDVKNSIEKLMGAGALSKPGFLEKVGYQFKKHPWLFLLLILGGIAGPAGLAAGGLALGAGALGVFEQVGAGVAVAGATAGATGLAGLSEMDRARIGAV